MEQVTFANPSGDKSRPDSHKVEKKTIFDPFVRTSSLFPGIYCKKLVLRVLLGKSVDLIRIK